jgi:hypothetical protein
MDKRIIKTAQEAVLEAAREAFSKNDALKDFVIDMAGGSFGAVEATLKFRMTPRHITAPTTSYAGGAITDVLVKDGFAKPGTPITYRDRLRNVRKGTIIKARQKKYLFRDELEQKEYVINFSACSLDESRMPKPVVG